jgi:dipeptidyl aminopeptidase/acylaminoacyl peptidase
VSDRRIAPYGAWSSPITPAMLATSRVRLSQTWFEDGSVYWLEGRPAEGGRNVLCRGDAFSSPADLTPEGFNVRTKVHEYGGGAYTVDRGVVYFSNFADQRLYRHEPGAGDPVAITPETGGAHRYADGRLAADGRTWVGVRERHDGPGPEEVVNEIVTMPTDGAGEIGTIVGGRDFFSNPRISRDGMRLAWLCWDLPWMPWDGCELFVGDLAADGSVSNARLVAGASGSESIWQPEWSPSGDLHWVSDRTGWWNLEAEIGGERRSLCAREAEFGWPQWVFGGSSYAFLDDGRIVCHWQSRGVQHTAVLDPQSGELVDLDVPHTAVSYPALRASGTHVVFVAGGPTIPEQVVMLDFQSRSVDVLRDSRDGELDEGLLSEAEQIEFPTEDGLTAFAHVYAPRNAAFDGPRDERAPLIVISHGGPTSESTPAFNPEIQFWTSRGFAVVDVNYGGSTGFGRVYRQRLNGAWGLTDTHDCINAARFLVERGDVDGSRLLIRGGSAGGYTTLCALTFHDVFAAGASYYGLADLEPFMRGGTHKFESRYLVSLVGPYPEAIDVYRARSPIHSVDLLSCPMLLLQGAEDEVVPPAQAEIMVEALERKGLPYAYLLFEGEQHGFRMAEAIQRAAEAELSFYSQILGFEPGDPIPELEITNLP